MGTVTPVSFEPIIIFGGLFIVFNLKVHLEVCNMFPLLQSHCSFFWPRKKNMIYATLESFEVIDIE